MSSDARDNDEENFMAYSRICESVCTNIHPTTERSTMECTGKYNLYTHVLVKTLDVLIGLVIYC